LALLLAAFPVAFASLSFRVSIHHGYLRKLHTILIIILLLELDWFERCLFSYWLEVHLTRPPIFDRLLNTTFTLLSPVVGLNPKSLLKHLPHTLRSLPLPFAMPQQRLFMLLFLLFSVLSDLDWAWVQLFLLFFYQLLKLLLFLHLLLLLKHWELLFLVLWVLEDLWLVASADLRNGFSFIWLKLLILDLFYLFVVRLLFFDLTVPRQFPWNYLLLVRVENFLRDNFLLH